MCLPDGFRLHFLFEGTVLFGLNEGASVAVHHQYFSLYHAVCGGLLVSLIWASKVWESEAVVHADSALQLERIKSVASGFRVGLL